MITSSIVIPEDVGTTYGLIGGTTAGVRACHLSVDSARKQGDAIMTVERDVHPGVGEVLDASTKAVLCLVSAPCQHKDEQGGNQ